MIYGSAYHSTFYIRGFDRADHALVAYDAVVDVALEGATHTHLVLTRALKDDGRRAALDLGNTCVAPVIIGTPRIGRNDLAGTRTPVEHLGTVGSVRDL